MNQPKLTLVCKFIVCGVLLAFGNTAFAEYYIVYPAPRPVTQCYECAHVRPIYKAPRHHYVKHKKVHHRKYVKRHRYVKPCNTCQISVYNYYPSCPLYVNNEWSSCACRGNCVSEYDFDMDRRTADDVTAELQLD